MSRLMIMNEVEAVVHSRERREEMEDEMILEEEEVRIYQPPSLSSSALGVTKDGEVQWDSIL